MSPEAVVEKQIKLGWPETAMSAGMDMRAHSSSAAHAVSRQTGSRPHGSQEMSGLNRNGCLLF
jgi:hypothetical protein